MNHVPDRTWSSRVAVATVGAIVLIIAAFGLGWMLRGDQSTTGVAANASGTDEAVEYTCSMHPQIRLTDPNAKCPICFMDLIPVARDDGGGGDGDRRLVMTPGAMQLAEIRTAPVERRYPTLDVRMFGQIDYDETRIATIAAYFPGRLERLYVDYTGIEVKKGEHLVLVYSPELIGTHAELREALAAVEANRGGSEMLRRVTEAKLVATRGKLRLWGLTDEQIRELERTDETLDEMTIHSPISGVVIHKMAVEGLYVKTGDPIYRVADFSHLWVGLEAYESQLPWLRFGQEVQFTTDSIPGTPFTGRISFIDPVVNRTTRTVRIRVNVDNADRVLKPGMFVRAVARARVAGAGMVMSDDLAGKWICPMHPEVIKDGADECDECGMPLVPIEDMGYVVHSAVAEPPLVIPASAPLITGRRAVVYVRTPDAAQTVFEGREVVLGPRAGDEYIVASGLAEGEQVVIQGAFKIDSAMQIRARPSMMSPTPTTMPATAPADPDAGTDAAAMPLPVPGMFLHALGPVFDGYLDAQEALAADDLPRFRLAAAALHEAIGAVAPDHLTADSRVVWSSLAARLRTDAEHLDHLADLDAARVLFETYSRAMLDLDRLFGHPGEETLFLTYCPMAFDLRGASWLARTGRISNPYFGASMLRCGKVQAQSPPRAAAHDGETGDER